MDLDILGHVYLWIMVQNIIFQLHRLSLTLFSLLLIPIIRITWSWMAYYTFFYEIPILQHCIQNYSSQNIIFIPSTSVPYTLLSIRNILFKKLSLFTPSAHNYLFPRSQSRLSRISYFPCNVVHLPLGQQEFTTSSNFTPNVSTFVIHQARQSYWNIAVVLPMAWMRPGSTFLGLQ